MNLIQFIIWHEPSPVPEERALIGCLMFNNFASNRPLP